MLEHYRFDEKDRDLLTAAAALLKKVANSETLRPAELVSVAKLQHVFVLLPRVPHDLEVTRACRMADYSRTLWMVPAVQSFSEAVADIDFARAAYRIEITDPYDEEDEGTNDGVCGIEGPL